MFDVLIKNRYAAMNIDAYNRTAVATEDIPNGGVFLLNNYKSGEDMLWEAKKPTTETAVGVWMASSPEIVITELPDGTRLKGIDHNVRNFVNLKKEMIDAFKPVVGDVLTIVPAEDGGFATKNFVGIDANKFTLKTLDAAPSGGGFYMEKIETTTMNIGDGSFVKKSVPAYKYVVRAN